MSTKIRTVFLKSVPYLMSIAGGIVLYSGAIDNAPNDNLRDLIIDISGSLLSIPLVFLLYDYMNSRVNRQMQKNLVNSISDRINTVILNIILILRESMGIRTKINTENINRMLILRASEISRRLKLTPKLVQQIHDYHNDLDSLLYHNGSNNVLGSEQTQVLSGLSREMGHFVNQYKFQQNRRLSARHLESIMVHILDWLDSDSVAALNFQQHLGPLSKDASGATK